MSLRATVPLKKRGGFLGNFSRGGGREDHFVLKTFLFIYQVIWYAKIILRVKDQKSSKEYQYISKCGLMGRMQIA